MYCSQRKISGICFSTSCIFLLIAAVQPSAHPQLIPNGSQQVYALVNKLTMTDSESPANAQSDASYAFKSMVQINSVWNSPNEQLLQVFFTESTISTIAGKGAKNEITQTVTKIPDRPFYISLIDGKPQKVIAHTNRDQSLLNLERGVASLLQLQYADDVVNELDVLGQCKVVYNTLSSRKVKKIKRDCSHWDLRVNYRSEKALGVLRVSNEVVDFELTADGSLLKVQSFETHRVSLEAKPDVFTEVKSEFSLNHIVVGGETVLQLDYPSLDEAIKSLLEWYRVFDIEADVDGLINDFKGISLKQQLQASVSHFGNEHIGKEALAVTLAEMLPLARVSKKDEFIDILQDNEDLRPQLVDLLGAVQNIESHNAINEAFNYNEEQHVELIERYLQSLAVGTHPERAIIEDLYKKFKSKKDPIENEKLRDSVLQTIAALTRQSSFDVNDPLVQNIRSYIIEQLTMRCKDAKCKTLYIRALQNLQDSSTISVLIKYAMDVETPVSVAAIAALKTFSVMNFNEKHRQIFAQIFYQKLRKYDSTARIYALDILLALKPTKEQLGEMLDYLTTNDPHFEIKTYVIQKLKMLAEKCPRFNALLKSCLAERPKVNNYHIFGQKGLTTVLTRQLSQAPAFNESLVSIQEIYQGVLKRGTVELVLNAGREQTSTFKLGLFTSGLNSFVGENDANIADNEVDNDIPVTAGMEISVQGVSLRPLIFFNGQTELMGHVWSGTVSESTPAYQATTLLQDHEHYLILNSGATVYLRIIGTKSIDLNGKADFSLWNRNANTEINQNTATAIVSEIVAGFTYARVEHQYKLTSEPNLILQANVDFYSDMKLCMQLQRPEMLLTYASKKSVLLKAEKPFTKTMRKTIKHKSPGFTLVLNQKNNDMCNMIFH